LEGAVTKYVVFALSIVLVAAHMTGQMRALGAWFDVTPAQMMYVIALPISMVATFLLLNNKS
jgi:hypothetical protein